MFFFHSSKIEGPNWQSLSYEKTELWCYLILFDEYLLFILTFVSHYCDCLFKDYFEIYALTS